LRRGEALGLRWKDLDLDAGTLRTALSLSPKRELKALKTARNTTRLTWGWGLWPS